VFQIMEQVQETFPLKKGFIAMKNIPIQDFFLIL